jgi:hypothetical protein
VRADPEPLDDVVFENTETAPARANADGENVWVVMDLLEMKAGMGVVGLPEAVVFAGLGLDAQRKSPEADAKFIVED